MLTRLLKDSILSDLLRDDTFLGKYSQHSDVLGFLGKIWDLKDMPSTDERFKTAYEDIQQHVIRNNDWDYNYLLRDRLNLLGGNEDKFIQFLEAVVHPTVRRDADDIQTFVTRINNLLQTSGQRLVITDYFEELPVYRYRPLSEAADLPVGIEENRILFFTTRPQNPEYPYFLLTTNPWDDYGHKTTFSLTYHAERNVRIISIGKVKIMRRGELTTAATLPSSFTKLDADFCSLGQTKEYYDELKSSLRNRFSSVMMALRDVAIFPKINELFENDTEYKQSLIRSDVAERLVRTVRYQIEGVSPNEYYKFTFTVQPPYADAPISLNFDFEYNTDYEHRIYALIGKNGTGKTRILSNLIEGTGPTDSFTPRKPVYGKVFTVSYSYFDRFRIPESDASFNYVYCGLKKPDGTLKSDAELDDELYHSATKIKQRSQPDDRIVNSWYAILGNFLPDVVLNNLKFETIRVDRRQVDVFDRKAFNSVKTYLSSGENILLYAITRILADIRFDSLIVYDEPETHLHPNAVNALMNTLFDLVKRFESFCIVATHSPLIVQEVPARNIFVIERNNSTASVRYLERESLGENLTVITQEIFGNRDMPKNFIKSINDLLDKGKTYGEIIDLLESGNVPINSNMRLYIKELQRNHEEP